MYAARNVTAASDCTGVFDSISQSFEDIGCHGYRHTCLAVDDSDSCYHAAPMK